MLANVQQRTIEPVITGAVAHGTLIHTDEYGIYARLPAWGYQHKTVCHGRGEYARDEDGDGFCEVHVNTIEGFWSLLRSWLRPHRGISQDKLPLYLGFFQFVHNARRRGKALLGALVAGVFAAPVADGLVPIAPALQAGIDTVLVGVDEGTLRNRGLDDRLDRDLLHVCQHVPDHRATALDHAEDGRLVLRQRASARRPS